MRSCLIAAAVLLALSLAEPGRAAGTFDLPHPTVITTVVDGVTLPVVGATKKQAQVRTQQGLQTLPPTAVFTFDRAVHFAPGRVRVEAKDANYTIRVTRNFRTGNVDADDLGIGYGAKLTSNVTYPNAYAVLMFVDRNFLEGRSDQTVTGTFFHAIGTLEANRPTEIYFDLKPQDVAIELRPHLALFLMVFADGREIQTDHDLPAAAFFRHLELVRFHRALAHYRDSHFGDSPVQLFQAIPPYFDDSIPTAALPPDVAAKFVVTPGGMVDGLQLLEPLPDAAAAAVRRSVAAWLFLPRLASGVPQPSVVQLRVALGVRPAAKP